MRAPFQTHSPTLLGIRQPAAELDRLGAEIAELSAYLDAATARLLGLIRALDARGGWNTGFRSCAPVHVWRVGVCTAAGPQSAHGSRVLRLRALHSAACCRM